MSRKATEEVHHGQIMAQYRKVMGWSQQDLADALGVSLRTVQRMEQEAVMKNLERRRFLVALLGIPAAFLGLDQERQEINTLVFNEDPMSFLEDTMASRWKAQLMGGPVHAAQGLDRFVNEVIHFAHQVQGQAWHRRAQAQLCTAYQLQGSVAGDMLLYVKALKAYQKAYTVAHELQDAELMAAVRVREGVIFMRQEEPLKAITYLNNALDLTNGWGVPHLRGDILTLLSEAYAKAQQGQECWHAIGLAECVLEQEEPVRERNYRVFSIASVTAHKGVDALLLRDYDRALKLIEKSLKTYNPTLTPGRARLLARKAEAYYGLKMISDCTDTAEEALTLASSVGASNTIVRLRELHSTILQSRWSKELGVRRLGALLATQR